MYNVLRDLDESPEDENYCGVGLSIFKDDPCTIRRVKDKSSAHTSGITPGSIIMKINKENVSDWDTEALAGSIIGKCGSLVKITVKAPNGKTKRHLLVRSTNIEWKK